jgi:putative hydrolase of the HAD superfamily
MPYLIWDFDNTLAYRPGLWSQCLVDLVKQVLPNTQLTRDDLLPHLSKGFPWHTPENDHVHLNHPDAWWNHLLPMLTNALISGGALEVSLATKIATRVRTEFTNPEKWVVFPDTMTTLSALSEHGWRHVVLSNHIPELAQLIRSLNLNHHFEHIITSALLGYEKPHALAFQAAVALIPANEYIVMVGDSFVADYQGAKLAGLPAYLVRSTHPECTHSFPDLDALLRHLISTSVPIYSE